MAGEETKEPGSARTRCPLLLAGQKDGDPCRFNRIEEKP
jgi:hypothetical protein